LYGAERILFAKMENIMKRLLTTALLIVLSGVVYAKNEIQCKRPPRNQAQTISQSDIPFTASVSGIYNVTEDLTYTGSGAAITINESNVTLNFRSASLTLSNQSAVGVQVSSSSNITLSNGSITNTASGAGSGTGIELVNVNKASIDSFLISDNFIDLLIQNSTDVSVTNSQFLNGASASVNVSGSTNISFSNDVFTINNPQNFTGNGLLFTNGCQDCSVTNCAFPNSGSTNLFAQEIAGLMIQSSSFSNSGLTNTSNLIQIGDNANKSSDVTIRGSSFANNSATETALAGLVIANGQSFIIDSNVFSLNMDDGLAAIQVGSAQRSSAFVIGAFISNNVIQGGTLNGIYIGLNTSNSLVQGNLVSGASQNGISLAGAFGATVENNTVTGNGSSGIALMQASSTNAVLGNTVSNNGLFNTLGDGIFVQGSVPGFAPSTNNLIQGNLAFGNANYGIENAGLSNNVLGNTAYSNVTGNYFPASTISNVPGQVPVVGGNIGVEFIGPNPPAKVQSPATTSNLASKIGTLENPAYKSPYLQAQARAAAGRTR
jgi:parallel beta-helix repeat protein